MSFVIAAPEMMTAAAADLAGIGSSLSEANAAAAPPTTGVIAAAEDEISAAIASLFSSHGAAFQALSAQAAAFHSEFVQALNAGAGAYARIEAANAGPLQTVAQLLVADPIANVAISVDGHTLLQLGSATATSGTPGDLAIAFGMNSAASATAANHSIAIAMGTGSTASAGFNGNHDIAIAMGAGSTASAGFNGNHDTATVMGAGSTASAGFNGNHDLATVNGNMLTAKATGGNHLTDIVTPSGTAGGAVGMLVPNVAAADPSPLVSNVAVSVFGLPLVQLGTAHATSGLGSLAIAMGANSDAAATGFLNSAFALGAGSNATVVGNFLFFPGIFDTAIAVGTNDVATAGPIEFGVTPPLPPLFPTPLPFGAGGSFDTAFVLGTGSTAHAGAGPVAPGPGHTPSSNFDLAAVVNGDMLTATATGANFLVDLVTPFGTL
jgi:hypothetical protein